MTAEDRARRLLDRFAAATGLTTDAEPRRYLWTDAFAVSTWTGLGATALARRLVDRVHGVLGRHRPDDARDGWISGLPADEARRRPTVGGLRIGKPLPERAADDPYDRRLEWERDGQYFHYLTQWIRALDGLALATGEAGCHAWGVELGLIAFERFGHGVGPVPDRLYWKMSIDLSRPVVPSQGQHDPLDGYVTLSALRDRVARPDPPKGKAAALDGAIDALAGMVEASELETDDPLGTGSLLTNAWFLARVAEPNQPRRRRILERTLDAAEASLAAVRRTRLLELPAAQRLAFRELGLAMGLAAATRLADPDAWGNGESLPTVAQQAGPLAGWSHLGSSIREFWLEEEHRAAPTWTDHEDINTVMLAASLAPDGYLQVTAR